jgi:hypothetical protein
MNKHLLIERCATRDFRVPLYADDEDCSYGWQTLPPAPRPDDNEWGAWEIVDDSSDKKTVWQRTARASCG